MGRHPRHAPGAVAGACPSCNHAGVRSCDSAATGGEKPLPTQGDARPSCRGRDAGSAGRCRRRRIFGPRPLGNGNPAAPVVHGVSVPGPRCRSGVRRMARRAVPSSADAARPVPTVTGRGCACPATALLTGYRSGSRPLSATYRRGGTGRIAPSPPWDMALRAGPDGPGGTACAPCRGRIRPSPRAR